MRARGRCEDTISARDSRRGWFEMNLDTSALTTSLSSSAVAAFRRTPGADAAVKPEGKWGWVTLPLGVAVMMLLLGAMVPILQPFGMTSLPIAVVVFPIVAAVALATGVFIVRRRKWKRLTRLAAFAQANGMTFIPLVASPRLPGVIFNTGRLPSATNVMRMTAPRFVEFADYEYSLGTGRDSVTQHWRYIAIRLETRLPHIILDARSNNVLGSGFPVPPDASQHLSLEGDFDTHFRLFCPHGYEADALYLFTPDVMATLIDALRMFDVEIVDNWVLLYTRPRPRPLDPVAWEWQFRAVDAIVARLSQWERWRDDRLA